MCKMHDLDLSAGPFAVLPSAASSAAAQLARSRPAQWVRPRHEGAPTASLLGLRSIGAGPCAHSPSTFLSTGLLAAS